MARALDHVRDLTVDAMRAWLTEQRNGGRLEIGEDLVETVCAQVGKAARAAAGTGVAEAFQIGINRSATDADHEADTARIDVCLSCGQPKQASARRGE